MTDVTIQWDRKILTWENWRYSNAAALNPLAWTVRARLRAAAEQIRSRFSVLPRIIDLGCGSGYLAMELESECQSYWGLDSSANAIAAARLRNLNQQIEFHHGNAVTASLPNADLTVMLGLSDWLTKKDFANLLGRLTTPAALMTYTVRSELSPYRAYRKYSDSSRKLTAQYFEPEEIRSLSEKAGFKIRPVYSANVLNPGAMIWAIR